MPQQTEAVEVRNPWYNPQSSYSRRVFCYSGKCLFSHRGVSVYRNVAGSWDYVIGGCAITQRAGFDRTKAAAIIDGLLDGTEERYVAQAVHDHLVSLGFRPCAPYPTS